MTEKLGRCFAVETVSASSHFITFRQNSSLYLLLRLSNCCRFSKTGSLIGAFWMSTYLEALESTDPKLFLGES